MEYGQGQVIFMLAIILVVITPLLSHLVATRFFRLFRSPEERQKGVAVSAIFGLLPVLLFSIPHLYSGSREGSGTCLPEFIYIVLLYGAAAYVYFHFFNMSETSRRIRILVSVRRKATQENQDVSMGYSIPKMLENRLERLVSLGEINISGGQYRIASGRLLLPAKIVAFFRQLLFPESPFLPGSWPKTFILLLAILGLAIFINTNPFLELPTPYGGILLVLACGLVGTIAFALLSDRPCLKNYLLVSAPYLFLTFGFVFSDAFPGRDSQIDHFPVFQFFTEAIANGFGAPTWLPITGGVDVGYYHINYFPFLPHRLAGYTVAALFPVSMVTAYKIQLVLGVLFFAYGWFAVIAHLTKSQQAAYWGTICILMGGTGITFHQEQVIATCHLLPWFTLCLLKIRGQHLYILPASALFGLGLSTHYPQIQIISMAMVAIAVFIAHRPKPIFVYSIAKKYSCWVGLLLLLGSLPALNIWYHGDELASGVRGMESLRPTSYAEYEKLNKQQISSAKPFYFSQYYRPYHEETTHQTQIPSDQYGMFVGRLSLLLCIIGLFFRPALAGLVLLLLIGFSELTIGINSHLLLPKLLFESGFPFINVFRQWYHFFPFVNFSLSLLAALGFALIFNRVHAGTSQSKKYVLLILIFLNFIDLTYYDHIYLQEYCSEQPRAPMQQYIYDRQNRSATFQYKDRFKLTRDCPKAIPRTPFITTAYTTSSLGVQDELASSCLMAPQGLIVTNIQSPAPDATKRFTSNIDETSQIVTPWGVNFQIDTPVPSLLVSMVNYSLGASVYVDGQPAKSWRANSAISGVLLEAGSHKVEFIKSGGWYAFISWLQVLLYGGTILSILTLAAKKQTEDESPSASTPRLTTLG